MGTPYPKFGRARRGLAAPHRPRTRRRRRNPAFLAQVALSSLFVGLLAWNGAPRVGASWTAATSSDPVNRARERSVYYRNCDAARAAGAAPVYAGQPGYRAAMDGDSDGIACEPYRGR